ncbi:MAG: hypothetical protein IJT46_01030 [Bacteroidaceae bacterium]|nr:hypothetical protein [Bacteroidaceae bacterium]
MSYTNRNFTWDFDALKRFYERYIVKWINSAVSWTEAQKTQARANLGLGDGSIDSEPTMGSDNLVSSGGVNDSTFEFDVLPLNAKTESRRIIISGDIGETEKSDIYSYNIEASKVLCIIMPKWDSIDSTTLPIIFRNQSGHYVGSASISLGNSRQHVFCVSPDDAAELIVTSPKDGFAPIVKCAKFDLQGFAKYNRGILEPVSIDDNTVVSYLNGNLSSTYNRTTKTYNVSAGNIVCIDIRDIGNSASLVSFYNGNPGTGTYMKAFAVQGSGSDKRRKLFIVVPNGAQYMRTSGHKSSQNLDSVSYVEGLDFDTCLTNSSVYTALNNDVLSLGESVDTLNDNIEHYLKTDVTETEYAETDMDSGMYRTDKQTGLDIGVVYNDVIYGGTSTRYKCLKVEVKKDDILTISTRVGSSNNLRAYLLTDSSKTVLEWSEVGVNSETPITINVQEDGYVYVNKDDNSMSGYTFSVGVVRKIVSGKLPELEADVAELKNLVIADDTNPLSIVKETAGLTPILHKIGVIGASFTNGAVDITSGSVSIDIRREFSWPQRLASLCGITAYNFGQPGMYCSQWLNDVGGYYTAMAQSGNECYAYIISFASNDVSKADYPLGTIADVNIGNESNNAASYYGYLSKIIARCHAVIPKSYLFMLTYPYNYSQTDTNGYNQAMRDLVEAYRNAGYKIYLLDYATYGMEISEATERNMYRGTHFVPAGYQYMTYEICTYLDWIIKNNMDDFKEIGFVLTDAEYSE